MQNNELDRRISALELKHAQAGIGGGADDRSPAGLLGALKAAVAALDLATLETPTLIGIENLLMQVSDHVTARYFDLSSAPGPKGRPP